MMDPKNQKTDQTQESTVNREDSARKLHALRERAMDKTLADSFPASDPPSSIPDPESEDIAA